MLKDCEDAGKLKLQTKLIGCADPALLLCDKAF